MQLQILAPILGVVGLVIAFVIYNYIKSQPAGNEKMVEISEEIHKGAMAFLKREYKVLAIFMVVVFGLMLLAPSLGWRTGVAFLGGALCSIFAGFFGMQAATKANVRTSEAARSKGIAAALMVSYSGGSVMGLAVASLGLIGVGIAFIVWGDPQTSQYINGFAMGASSIALFARVGGGIFTKAADVGSDLVGKIEAGIPEDDPRNPGVIADNVGDNVGDIAGMGADIFESYVGAIIATIAIAATASVSTLATLGGTQASLMFLPILLGGCRPARFSGRYSFHEHPEKRRSGSRPAQLDLYRRRPVSDRRLVRRLRLRHQHRCLLVGPARLRLPASSSA